MRVDLVATGRGLGTPVGVRLLPPTDPAPFERHVGVLPAVREIVFVTVRFGDALRLACEDADDLDARESP